MFGGYLICYLVLSYYCFQRNQTNTIHSQIICNYFAAIEKVQKTKKQKQKTYQQQWYKLTMKLIQHLSTCVYVPVWKKKKP